MRKALLIRRIRRWNQVLTILLLVVWSFVMGLYFGRGVEPTVIGKVVLHPVFIETVREVEPTVKPREIDPVEEVIIEPVYILEETNQEINADFDVMKPCGFSARELRYALSTESYKAMIPYVDTLVEAERTHGVNALYLLCTFGLESGWGKHHAAPNNIGGWTDTDGSYLPFDSVEECIMHIAEKISTEYREEVGSRLEDVCYRYCPLDGYLELLMDIMANRQEKILGMC